MKRWVWNNVLCNCIVVATVIVIRIMCCDVTSGFCTYILCVPVDVFCSVESWPKVQILHGVRSGGKETMTVQLKPPSPFPFHRPDEWQKWRRRFEQFREASGLSTESQQRQISTLLYTMGEEAEDTLMSTRRKTTPK